MERVRSVNGRGIDMNREPHFASADECRRCPYAMPCVSQPSGANLRIAPRTVFDCIFSGSTLSGSISTLLTSVEQQVRSAADARFGAGSGSRLSGGINNARGEWLEYALKVIFWNSAVEHGNGNTVIVKLPNAAQLQFRDLYEPRAKAYLDELFQSLKDRGMDMQMSNPDFICVTGLPEESELPSDLVGANEQSMDMLDAAHERLIGKCNADAIPFVITVKTSTRPDRRYQIVHEANVVKSLVAHLGGRFWNRDLYTAFYAMISSRVSPADRNALRNPATYTLVQVNWTPVPLVDEVYQIDFVDDVREIVRELLERHVGGNADPIS